MMFAVPSKKHTSAESLPYRRVQLSQGLHTELNEQLIKQADRLLSSELERVDYCGDFTPGDDEVLIIKNYMMPDELQGLLKPSANTPPLDDNVLTNGGIGALIANVQTGSSNIWVGQVFNQNQVLNKSQIRFYWQKGAYTRMENAAVIFGRRADVVWSDGSLYFANFAHARRILPLEDYYAEASQEQLEEFLELDRIAVNDKDSFFKLVDKPMRKKIALILKTQAFKHAEWDRVETAARTLYPELILFSPDGANSIILPTEKKALQAVLAFMNEDVFEGALTQTPYRTNSKRKV